MTRNNHKARFVCGSMLALLVGCAYEEMKIVAQTGGASNNGTGGKSNTGGISGNGGSSDDSRSRTGGAPSTGGSKSSTQATGGKSAAGGTQATGGTKATGGTSSAGGTTSAVASGGTATGGTISTIATGGAATGGVGATGGISTTTASAAVGGVTSIGGTNATGGAPTTGGAPATGGTTACIPAPTTGTQVINSFDSASSITPFAVATYVFHDCLVNAGAANDAGATEQLTWSGAVDYDWSATTKGAMAIIATFTDWDQQAEAQLHGIKDSCGQPMNLTNKIVRVRIMVASGLSPLGSKAPFGAQLYIQTGSSYVWGSSPWLVVNDLNTWLTLSLDMGQPNGVPTGQTYDPTDPEQVGIQLLTTGGGESSQCARDNPTAFGNPVQSVIYVDQITVEDRT